MSDLFSSNVLNSVRQCLHVKQCDCCRYIHDGSEVLLDTLTISVSDGNNRVAKAIDIDIVPVDDESPRVRSGLRPHLIVSEGSEVVISSKMLAATDEDTGDDSLVFLIVKQPK